MPGSSYVLWESSALSGIDFPVLRIRVTPPTANPVTTIPQTLVNIPLPQQADVDRTRQKTFSGNGMVGMGMFYINSLMYDMNVINDTVLHGATEMWTVLNASDIAHPFHMHGVSFRVLDRDFQPPQPWEQGLKDMVLVDMAQTVRLLVKFDEYTGGWPFMYHCHNLLHEDNMMMLQFIVVDPSTGVSDEPAEQGIHVSPSPTNGPISFSSDFPIEDVLVADMQGRTVLRMRAIAGKSGRVDLSDRPDGAYVLQLNGGGRTARTVVIKE
jgi:bilirubin oxidase